MKTSELNFTYPAELVATKPQRPSRVMWVKNQMPLELEWDQFLQEFRAGDLIVYNNTKVTPLRVWAKNSAGESVDVLFVRHLEKNKWEVLAPLKKMKMSERWRLPEDVEIIEVQNGIPQTIQLSAGLGLDYFIRHGEVPLPPYILKARGNRHSTQDDHEWYQSIFAENFGSSAAPTASLHFRRVDFDLLKSKGVRFAPLTLHVGPGTYLPVTVDNLDDHKMHSEPVEIPAETWRKVIQCEGRVWALGTTVARALESAQIGKLKKDEKGFHGTTDLLIQPGYDYKVLRGLLTNFHQPESTLLALVAAFAGLGVVKSSYAWAIEKKFRLFSYGDLTAWENS